MVIRTRLKTSWQRFIYLLFGGIFTTMLIVACSSTNSLDSSRQPDKDCRVVQHTMGEACIPRSYQNVVVTDETALDTVIGLNIIPIATAEPNAVGKRGRQFKGKAEGLASLGKDAQFSIEKIAALNPDLIVGFFMNSQQYKLCSQIAPTIKLEVQYLNGTWKDSFLKAGKILDRTEKAQNAIALYQQRVNKLRQAIDEQLGDVTVSVVRFRANQEVQFYTMYTFHGTIFEELEISAPSQQLSFATTPDVTHANISLEKLELIDADVLFVMLDPESEDNFQQYQQSLLWQKLNVVKNKRVYTVDSGYWNFGNIMAANAILDDVEQYLLNSDSDL